MSNTNKTEELTTEQKLNAFQYMEEITDAMCLFYAVFKDNDFKTHIHLFPSFDDGKFIWAFETKEYRKQQMEEYRQSEIDNSSATYNEVIDDLKRENQELISENGKVCNTIKHLQEELDKVKKENEGTCFVFRNFIRDSFLISAWEKYMDKYPLPRFKI